MNFCLLSFFIDCTIWYLIFCPSCVLLFLFAPLVQVVIINENVLNWQTWLNKGQKETSIMTLWLLWKIFCGTKLFNIFKIQATRLWTKFRMFMRLTAASCVWLRVYLRVWGGNDVWMMCVPAFLWLRHNPGCSVGHLWVAWWALWNGSLMGELNRHSHELYQTPWAQVAMSLWGFIYTHVWQHPYTHANTRNAQLNHRQKPVLDLFHPVVFLKPPVFFRFLLAQQWTFDSLWSKQLLTLISAHTLSETLLPASKITVLMPNV